MTEVAPSARLDCPHAARCAGCALSELDYRAQLASKTERLTRELGRYGALEAAPLAPIVPAPALTGYRVRAKLVAQGRALGMFARGTHEVVDIPECRLSTPRVSAAVAAVRARLPFDFELSGVDVREVDAGTLVTLLVPERTSKSALERAAQALLASDAGIVGVSESRRAARSPRLLGAAPRPLAGPGAAPHHLEPGGPYHFAAAGSFVQAFPAQAGRLFAAVERALAERLGGIAGRTLLELFAGSGALSLRLAASGARVTAVDSHAPGIEALERAAREQRLDLRARAGRAELALESASGADAVIVDPPRRGLSPELRASLARAGARVIVYVSCEPSTLARDLAHLAELGYRTTSVVPFDLIPLSDSVETLAVLEPHEPPPLCVVASDDQALLVELPPHLPAESLRERLGAAVPSPPGPGPLPPSGIAAFPRSRSALSGRAEFVVLARGITRGAGNLGAASYRRLRVVGTHSLLRLSAPLGAESAWLRALERVGHPVLGAERHGDARSNRHFLERHGLDRAFAHCTRLELDSGAAADSALAADLEAVLSSLSRPSLPDSDP